LAATRPGEPERALSGALAQIAAMLSRQTSGLEAIQSILLRLPQDVGQTVAEGVREALSISRPFIEVVQFPAFLPTDRSVSS
jgi:hypothetical protein